MATPRRPGRARSPSMTAVSSMRWLVDAGSAPDSSRSLPPSRMMAPQPPGPGVPRQGPAGGGGGGGGVLWFGPWGAWGGDGHPAAGARVGLRPPAGGDPATTAEQPLVVGEDV